MYGMVSDGIAGRSEDLFVWIFEVGVVREVVK